ncbi:MAG: PEPxxWA-CTERM sorting domain-containing protein [Pseudomonadota bacterium]
MRLQRPRASIALSAQETTVMRPSVWPLSAAILSLGLPAAGAPFIGFTDNTFDAASFGSLSDTQANAAVGWTQTVATTDVTVRALLGAVTGASGNWWITTKLGPTATLADVVASGVYTAPSLGLNLDFNGQPRTELASGLSFAAGAYFLVLDGPPGPAVGNASWIGGAGPADTVELAAGFTLGSYYHATQFDDPLSVFGPASSFVVTPGDPRLVFELDGRVAGVPEPATWLMLIAGFGLMGTTLRRRTPASA